MLAFCLVGYVPPHRNQVRRELKRLYGIHASRLRDSLKTVEYLSLTADFWSDRQNRSFFAITGHYFTDQMDQKSTVLHFQSYDKRHTSLDIATEVFERLQELGIERKITSVTCDGAQNMKNAFDMLDGVDRFWCTAHRLHLTICNGLGLWKKHKKFRSEGSMTNAEADESVQIKTPLNSNEMDTVSSEESGSESIEGIVSSRLDLRSSIASCSNTSLYQYQQYAFVEMDSRREKKICIFRLNSFYMINIFPRQVINLVRSR